MGFFEKCERKSERYSKFLFTITGPDDDPPNMNCQVDKTNESPSESQGNKRRMILLVKDEDGKLREVKICGLSRAAATDDAETVCELLEKVADDSEFLKTALRCKDACFGYTAFHWAAKYGSTDAMRVLLQYSAEHGNIHMDLNKGSQTYSYNSENQGTASVSSVFNHDSPLHVACQSGQLDCVKLLVEYGMSPEATNNRNRTALHLACEELHLPVIKYFV